jgi:hypothetical protein
MILIMTLTSMFSVSILICGETLTRINLAAPDSEQSDAALGYSGVAGGPAGGDRQWIDGIDQLQELVAGQRRREYIALRRADADLAQMDQLLESFRAVGHHVHAHIVRKFD